MTSLLTLFAFAGQGCTAGFTSGSSDSSSYFATDTVSTPPLDPAIGFAHSRYIPQPPAEARISRGVQQLSSWHGQTGAVSQCPNGVPSATCHPVNANFNPALNHTTDPSPLAASSNIAGEFQFFTGPAFATALWGHAILTDLTAHNFIWDFFVYVDSIDYYASEMDFYTTLNNGQRFMMGSQCNRAKNTWDTWNERAQKWIPNPSVPCNKLLSPNTWHRVTFYNTVNPVASSYAYRVLRIDGVDYVLDQTQPTQFVGWTDGVIGVQMQLDAAASGQGVNEYIENMDVYAW